MVDFLYAQAVALTVYSALCIAYFVVALVTVDFAPTLCRGRKSSASVAPAGGAHAGPAGGVARTGLGYWMRWGGLAASVSALVMGLDMRGARRFYPREVFAYAQIAMQTAQLSCAALWIFYVLRALCRQLSVVYPTWATRLLGGFTALYAVAASTLYALFVADRHRFYWAVVAASIVVSCTIAVLLLVLTAVGWRLRGDLRRFVARVQQRTPNGGPPPPQPSTTGAAHAPAAAAAAVVAVDDAAMADAPSSLPLASVATKYQASAAAPAGAGAGGGAGATTLLTTTIAIKPPAGAAGAAAAAVEPSVTAADGGRKPSVVAGGAAAAVRVPREHFDTSHIEQGLARLIRQIVACDLVMAALIVVINSENARLLRSGRDTVLEESANPPSATLGLGAVVGWAQLALNLLPVWVSFPPHWAERLYCCGGGSSKTAGPSPTAATRQPTATAHPTNRTITKR